MVWKEWAEGPKEEGGLLPKVVWLFPTRRDDMGGYVCQRCSGVRCQQPNPARYMGIANMNGLSFTGAVSH